MTFHGAGPRLLYAQNRNERNFEKNTEDDLV